MAQVTVSDLTFSYTTSYVPVFEHVSFQFDTDWKLGFVGRNGRGKTTFLKLLLGEYEYGGSIAAPTRFSYFPFPVAETGRSTLAVVRGVCPDFEHWELCRELNLLQVPEETLERPFESLSPGERTKTLIAALFLQKNHFLLLDEPTNHLDALGKQAITKYLASKKGFLLVSHDRALLDQTSDHILSINKTNIEIQSGNFSQWLADKTLRDESEAAQNRLLRRDVVRLQDAARRAAGWSDKTEASKIGTHTADRGAVGHKAAKMMKRAKSIETRREKAAEEKAQLLKNVETQETIKLLPLTYHSALLAEFADLSIAYTPGHEILRGVNLQVKRGDRIALKGRNGSGKSSLIKLLTGADIPHTGRVHIGGGLVLSYAPQDASRLRGNLQQFADTAGGGRTLFLSMLRKLGLERELFEHGLEALSDGQKKKVLIAKSLSESAHLYVWDEPLNYMDIQSRMQIEELILKYQPTMVFVEHDETFVQNIATAVFDTEDNI